MIRPIFIVLCVLALLGLGLRAPRQAPHPPVAVFAELDGVWEGTFVGYDETGRELYRISVRQEYETVSDVEQKVRITDTMPDGTVIRGEGENLAQRAVDGSLELHCSVRKSNGERVHHTGRLVTGPGGQQQIVWYSKAPDRVETFREEVCREGDEVIYEINGMGRYNDSLILMAGRYTKQPDD